MAQSRHRELVAHRRLQGVAASCVREGSGARLLRFVHEAKHPRQARDNGAARVDHRLRVEVRGCAPGIGQDDRRGAPIAIHGPRHPGDQPGRLKALEEGGQAAGREAGLEPELRRPQRAAKAEVQQGHDGRVGEELGIVAHVEPPPGHRFSDTRELEHEREGGGMRRGD